MTPAHFDSFYALGVRPDLVAALRQRGIVEPFPIQEEALPDALAGRDVLGRGRTGSGKTVAFALPVIERVLEAPERRAPRRPRALILVPTRELAVQVHDTVDFLSQAMGLRSMTVFGGVRYASQERRLERGVDIVVATPGRLEDLIAQGALALDDVRVVVLDEADMMADMGFLPPVTRVLDAVAPGQRLLFSATLADEVQQLVDRYLTDPVVHSIAEGDDHLDVEHYLFLVRHDNKLAVVEDLVAGGGRTLAFTRTKFGAERLAAQLTERGIPAVELHGNLRQGARQRNLAAFAKGRASVLVATDIAARGIHVSDVGLVVHVDPPAEHKAFLHRSGRTARAGAEGVVVTLATKNQNKPVRELMRLAKIKPTQMVVTPGDAILAQVRAARVEASNESIFTPDADDLIEGESDRYESVIEREARPGQQRAERPGRGGRLRPDRASRDAGDQPRRPHDERARFDRDGRGHGARTGRDRARTDRAQARRGEGRERAWGRGGSLTDGWGPEPWEVEDAPERRRGGWTRQDASGSPRRGAERSRGVGERAQRGREERPARGAQRWGREEQRGREERGERRDDSASRRSDAPRRDAALHQGERGGKAKTRWSAEDRRKAQASKERGFGYTKAGAKPKRKGVAADKDKGKPKRKQR